MKRMGFLVLISLMVVVTFVACSKKDNTASSGGVAGESGPFPGKIAVISSDVSQNEEEFRAGEQLVKKYGSDKVTLVTWPANFMAEQEQMVTIVQRLAADKDLKALIINQAVPGTNPAVDKLLETRKDVFIVYCTPQENPPDVSRRANLTLMPDELAMGPTMVKQAKALGAKVFVHYSFPRHMSQPLLSGRRDLIRQNCATEGLQFVDATSPDPTSDAGVTGSQQFILEDVPRLISRYGKDTAFFSTNCSQQIPLIKAIVDAGGIYPQPCCPSPYHGFPSALGIGSGEGLPDINWMISETRKVLASKNEIGRVSTWPAPASMTWTCAGAEYAIKWIKGEVPKTGIDNKALADCISTYIKEVTGSNVDASMVAYEENGITYDTFKMILMGYLTY
jgi:hypothetical protein